MSKKTENKNDAKVQLKGQQRLRRKWITWTRVVRYGMSSFTRNMWLTTAATAVTTIMLLIIFVTAIARVVLNDTVTDIRKKVDIPINLRSDATDRQINSLRQKFERHEDVVEVKYTSKEESKQTLLNSGKLTAEQLQAISELPVQPYYPVLKVVVKNPSDTSRLESLVNNDDEIQEALNPEPGLKPVFSGDKAKSIETISSWASTAEKAGLFGGVLFIAISMLIIFNTIRMAIFNRRDEIEMMKLIGADKGFIRGPFLVEAVLYGVLAAVIATAIGISLFLAVEPGMRSYGIATDILHHNLVTYSPLILLAMMVIGIIVGNLSARLAVRRYLKLS